MKAVSIALLIGISLIYTFLAIYAGRRYSKWLGDAPISRYYGKSRGFLPAGLVFFEWTGKGRISAYARKIEYRYKRIGFEEDSKKMLQAHMAMKFTLMCGSACFVCAVAVASGQADASFAVFAAGLPTALAFAQDRQLNESIGRRKKAIEAEFPIFLNKLVLLTGAGMNMIPAITKITADDVSGSHLYVELKKVLYDIETGRSFSESFERFSRSCGISEVNLFVSTLIQNIRKGSDDLIPVLRLLSESCWERRRNTARKSGEEMSTKLIFPTMLIFIAILILLMTPAFIQMSAV